MYTTLRELLIKRCSTNQIYSECIKEWKTKVMANRQRCSQVAPPATKSKRNKRRKEKKEEGKKRRELGKKANRERNLEEKKMKKRKKKESEMKRRLHS